MRVLRIWLRLPGARLAAVVLSGLALKAVLIASAALPFNADEAVVGLMARHILAGERPVFFYGQAYMGSLDAWLAAGGFLLLGSQVWVIRLVQSLLFAGTLVSGYAVARRVSGSPETALLAVGLLALPPVNVTLYTTVSLGGYGEALLLGNLITLAAFGMGRRLAPQPTGALPAWVRTCGWGFLAGFGFWANGLTLVYTLPAGLYLLWQAWGSRRRGQALSAVLLGGAAGAVLGLAPVWAYLASDGTHKMLNELLGSAVAVETGGWLERVLRHLLSYGLLGFPAALGLRPPWDVRWLALPLLPLALFIWIGAFIHFGRKLRAGGWQGREAELGVLLGAPVCVTAGFLFTSFGVDPSGRYFLPLALPLAVIAADAIRAADLSRLRGAESFAHRYPRAAGLALAAVLIAFQLGGTLESALRVPPGLNTQFDPETVFDRAGDAALRVFLTAQGETRGYTTYWVAYPLAFLSDERLIYIPRLPYHRDLRYTLRDDRYPPYDALVADSPRTAYITARQPELDALLRQRFSARGVGFAEQQIGDYRVFYGLTRAVRVDEIW